MHLSALIRRVVCVIRGSISWLGHGRFWRVTAPASRKAAPLRRSLGPIAVVIPARNEADVIGESVQSLLRQTAPT